MPVAREPKARDARPETLDARTRIISRADWIVAALITLAAVILHGVFWTHAGGLWRDEAAGVQLATLPSLSEVWRMLTHDSFPALLPLVLRLWAAIGLGGTDLHLRFLGLLVGLATLATIWGAARLMGRGAPTAALALLALNPICIRAGDTLRAYGLGSALIVLTMALAWRFAQKPTSARGILAAAAAILSVQCLYQNAFLVLGICVGGCALCYSQERWRDFFWNLGIGIVAAISLVPYLQPIARSQQWWIVEKVGFQPEVLWGNASQAMAFPGKGFDLVWIFLLVLGLGYAVVVLILGAKSGVIREQRDLILFSGAALVTGLIGFFFFIRLALLPTQPWYYLPILTFAAVCLDTIVARCGWRIRAGLIAFAVIVLAAGFPMAMPAVRLRQTNVDLIAAKLAKEASPNDMILVHPWYCGVSFQRYYRGQTPWTTLPPLDDHSIHRYDQLKMKMQMEDPIQPVLKQAAATLEAGNRVWIVGKLAEDNESQPEIHPAPDNSWGWNDEPYSQAWAAMAARFLLIPSVEKTDATPRIAGGVNPYEDLPVTIINPKHESSRDNGSSRPTPPR